MATSVIPASPAASSSSTLSPASPHVLEPVSSGSSTLSRASSDSLSGMGTTKAVNDSENVIEASTSFGKRLVAPLRITIDAPRPFAQTAAPAAKKLPRRRTTKRMITSDDLSSPAPVVPQTTSSTLESTTNPAPPSQTLFVASPIQDVVTPPVMQDSLIYRSIAPCNDISRAIAPPPVASSGSRPRLPQRKSKSRKAASTISGAKALPAKPLVIAVPQSTLPQDDLHLQSSPPPSQARPPINVGSGRRLPIHLRIVTQREILNHDRPAPVPVKVKLPQRRRKTVPEGVDSRQVLAEQPAEVLEVQDEQPVVDVTDVRPIVASLAPLSAQEQTIERPRLPRRRTRRRIVDDRSPDAGLNVEAAQSPMQEAFHSTGRWSGQVTGASQPPLNFDLSLPDSEGGNLLSRRHGHSLDQGVHQWASVQPQNEVLAVPALQSPIVDEPPMAIEVVPVIKQITPAAQVPVSPDNRRAGLPRRKVTGRRRFMPTETDNERVAVVHDTPPTRARSTRLSRDVGSCLQPLVPNLSIAFSDGPGAAPALTTHLDRFLSDTPISAFFPLTPGIGPGDQAHAELPFTHVISIIKPTRGRSLPNPSTGVESIDDDGTRRLQLYVSRTNSISLTRSCMGLTPTQLQRAAAFMLSASTQPETRLLVSTPGLLPGAGMAVAALLLATVERKEVQSVLRRIDEDEEVSGFWKHVVMEEEIDVLTEAQVAVLDMNVRA